MKREAGRTPDSKDVFKKQTVEPRSVRADHKALSPNPNAPPQGGPAP